MEEEGGFEDFLLLHGRLKVHIKRASDLPDTDTFFWNFSSEDYTDAYVTGKLGSASIFKTRYIPNNLDPVWDEKFDINICHHVSALKIQIHDKEMVKSEFVSELSINAQDLLETQLIEGEFDTLKDGNPAGKIELSVQFIPLEETSREVRQTYFPMRENCRMVMYQDADTPQLPQFEGITHPDESPYEATRAWKDLYDSLENAQKFIYITGWSVYTSISLLRGEEDPEGLSNVGELLKRKADEGVRVLILIWNEKMSFFGNEGGVLGTHDEETKNYFANTAVECILVSREKRGSLAENEVASTMYTHHQKTVICDALSSEDCEKRRIIAFIGGLDITDGRYDTTAQFPLFSTLNTVHQGDFYNNITIGSTPESGPREPWHDIHAKIEGPVALDIKKNFEERWSRQVDELESRLYEFDEEEFEFDAPATCLEHEGGSWNVQLFRSITSESCVMKPKYQGHLHSKQGRPVDNGIQKCMIQQIRSSQRFIYMENQYFLGSSYAWTDDTSYPAYHTIPMEITQKIIRKVKANEPFKVYIVIPMFPEGDPASAPIQEILFWQFRTMEMMYSKIGKAIEGTGIHPKNLLAFFCMAKRESPEEVPEDLPQPPPDSPSATIRQSLRHPIYVHSKMSLFDDEYIIIGSANINERSLGGNRDTEIAVGGFQPEHTIESQGDPRGNVHTFRQALWAAHLGGGHNEAFQNPESDGCMETVREIAEGFSEVYHAEEPQHSDVHLLPYPINVDEMGNVTSLDPPLDCFPDTQASVLGAKSGYLPSKLTT